MVEKKKSKKIKKIGSKIEPKFQIRPPIVTVMGHVDHGKTTLLDALRHSNLTAKESGGITQSIGAYQVKSKKAKGKTEEQEKSITFIDTPGHEAFTAMRSRGAKVTDIVVLVVAANDGVKPQTIEAIDHAKAAGVPIIVAVNKIDLPGASVDKVKEELSKHGIISEDWGGETIFVPISAKNKTNLDELLEMILLLAEMQELKIDPKTPFTATVIESHLDDHQGPLASIIIRSGVLKVGETVWVGEVEGKIRKMIDDRGSSLKEAKISMPVEIIGFKEVPPVGGTVTKEKKVTEKEVLLEEKQSLSLAERFDQENQCPSNELNIIIKAETQGALEAVIQSLNNFKQDKVKINILHQGTGLINESDILLTKVNYGVILAFRVKPSSKVLATASQQNVEVHYYDVIYKLLEDVEKMVKGEWQPKNKMKIIGQAKILTVFEGTKGKIAGVKILAGVLQRGKKVQILRNEEMVFEGKIKTMRHLKENVSQLSKDKEGGIMLEKDFDYQVGDLLQVV